MEATMFMGDATPDDKPELINVVKQCVFWLVHAACILVVFCGVSWIAVAVCFALYVIRMFAITGGYHRYFSHRSYKTSRFFQFVLGFLGATAAQKGPIWWASHHRHHHRYSDTPQDVHSPILRGIYYAHIGWVLSSEFINPRLDLVKDLTKFPEIRWLDKWNIVPPFLLGVGTFFLGVTLNHYYPSLHTSGYQMLIWGFFISTVLLYHGTFCINSFCHILGRRKFQTTDSSKNSFLLAIITLGEGWHNNHHYYQSSESQGLHWWEIDISHYIIKMLAALGLVWDIKKYPKEMHG